VLRRQTWKLSPFSRLLYYSDCCYNVTCIYIQHITLTTSCQTIPSLCTFCTIASKIDLLEDMYMFYNKPPPPQNLWFYRQICQTQTIWFSLVFSQSKLYPKKGWQFTLVYMIVNYNISAYYYINDYISLYPILYVEGHRI
jgi:hypothetical protein